MAALTADTTGDALARILERVTDTESFRVWCDEVGIDLPLLVQLSHLPEITVYPPSVAFMLGIATAWEVANAD